MTSTTSAKQIKRRQDLAKRDGDIDKAAVEALMSTGDGRRWLYLKLFYSGIWTEDGVVDPQQLAFKAGVRNEGLRLFASIMTHAAGLFPRLWSENVVLIENANKNAEEGDEPEEQEND